MVKLCFVYDCEAEAVYSLPNSSYRVPAVFIVVRNRVFTYLSEKIPVVSGLEPISSVGLQNVIFYDVYRSDVKVH